MGLGQVKKINNNIARPLNEFFNSMWNRVDTRRYFYNSSIWDSTNRTYTYTNSNSRLYTIPINGYYTIRAYMGDGGSYGKIIGKFSKGEQLHIVIDNATNIDVSSTKYNVNDFRINLALKAEVNAIGNSFISALAIGGSIKGSSGGHAYVRCNNGIAVGGGGTCTNPNESGGWIYGTAGGNAYAWGNNVYALGGGGGAGNSSSGAGNGGRAFVNDEEISTYCTYNSLRTMQSGRGYSGSSYNGGNGGTGGAGSRVDNIAQGYYSYGGQYSGGSAKCGLNVAGYGYFAGSYYNKKGSAGSGGFYGGMTWTNNYMCRGGTGLYGFGGMGYYGGDGQLKGGDGVYGGNGLKFGVGTTSNGNAVRHKSIIHTLPDWDKGPEDSIVIIEYGISTDNY